MLLSLFNNLNKADQEIRNGVWNREENRGVELDGKTIAIIGCGNNGSAFAQILKGFNINILAYDKYLDNYPHKSTLENIYRNADIVSIHIPLSKENYYYINDIFINNFKKNIYLINTSRGKCADTKSIIKSLKNQKIKGVCLDVFEYENNSFENLSNGKNNLDMKYLISAKNTILSPHIAGWSKESKLKISQVLLGKINSYFHE